MTTRKRYRGEAVDVSFDGARCRHAAECLRGLPAVFDVGSRPWIDPDRAGPDELMRVVARCPTGALRTGTPAYLGGALAWTFGLLAVFVPLCVWRYRRMR